MTIVEGEHFCSSCNRLLIDFTRMNEEEMKQALMKLVGTKACGMFRPENVQLTIKQKFIHRLRQVASFSIALFSVKAVQAKNIHQPIPATHNETEQAVGTYAAAVDSAANKYYGKLIDEKDLEAIGFVDVFLQDANGNEVATVTTDGNGIFEFDLPADSSIADYRIKIVDYGYKTTTVKVDAKHRALTDIELKEHYDLSFDWNFPTLKRLTRKEQHALFPRMARRMYHPVMMGAFSF
ncbi:MAG TPA: hypothetical protein VL651_03030 [Bacteroidia bacterium]|nr:hypothetical protein [Bacteroidia bacterium]